MSFIRAVPFKDVQPGDMVAEGSGEAFGWYQITACKTVDAATMHLRILGGGVLVGHPHQLIGLFHRSWPQGEAKMQEDILAAAQCLQLAPEAHRDAMAAKLRDAIDAYELGKPLKQE